MAIKKYGYGYARKKRLLKWEEDEENLFKKNHNPEENKKKNLHLQTGKNMAFSGRASHIANIESVLADQIPGMFGFDFIRMAFSGSFGRLKSLNLGFCVYDSFFG